MNIYRATIFESERSTDSSVHTKKVLITMYRYITQPLNTLSALAALYLKSLISNVYMYFHFKLIENSIEKLKVEL